jgi:hypothetical protein
MFIVTYDVMHGGNAPSQHPSAERAWTESCETFFSDKAQAEAFVRDLRTRAAYSKIKMVAQYD